VLVAVGRPLPGRSVNPPVGKVAPLRQVRLQRGHRLEGPVRQAVLLHEAHAVLGLALRPGSVRTADPRRNSPVPTESREALRPRHDASPHVVLHDERARVVHQDRPRQTPEVLEGPRQRREPLFLSPGPQHLYEDPSRVPQDGNEEDHLDPLPADPHAFLSKVGLHLLARWRLEAHSGQRLGVYPSPPFLHGPLHRPHARRHALLQKKVPHDHSVAAGFVSHEPLGLQPRQPAQSSSARTLLALGLEASPQVSPHRVPRHSRLVRDPLAAPSQSGQHSHPYRHLRIDHRHLRLSPERFYPYPVRHPGLLLGAPPGGQDYCRKGVSLSGA
jgi:hypothetical protein